MIKSNTPIVAGLCFLALFGTSCKMGEKKTEAQEQLVIVNVLDKKFYDDCHIDPNGLVPGAKNIVSLNVAMDDLEGYAQKHWDKEKTHIVVYCANYKCTASGESAKMLKDLGFKNVWAFEAGTADWKHKGYPVKGACQQGYLSDFEKPEEGLEASDVPVIETDALKTKIEKFSV